MNEAVQRLAQLVCQFCLAAIAVVGFVWLVDLPLRLGLPLMGEQFILVIAGLATAAGFLKKPKQARPGAIELTLALIALCAWAWAGVRYEDWLINGGHREAEKWLTGALALLLLLEATRRHCGNGIAILVGVFALYGLVGHWLPGVVQAEYNEPRRLIGYLYTDTNGVPGTVLAVASTIVLAFIFFSRCLGMTGAGKFFDQLSLALLGHYRGGPAKVAVGSSSLFGLISGSSVANVVSSGIVTIPLMKRHGFSPAYAGAVEAVASNAGQITPPVMGTTAFLIAEFLQIPYGEVVLAAIIPALIFYLALLVQIDSHAARNGLRGIARGSLPALKAVLAEGWVFLVPIALLVYLMFWAGTNVSKAALYAAGTMLLLAPLRGHRVPLRRLLRELTVGVGEDMLAILLVSAAAGIVIGVLNISGLSFSVTVLLTSAGQNAGMLAMLALTALIAVVLGMGMPTAAVYVLLSVVLAPTLVKMGIAPLPAHLFIFYFGLMSMLTPPVAMASYAAASIASADLWKTSIAALRLGAAGYLLPFIFVLNPALLGHGSAIEVVYAVLTVAMSAALIGWAVEGCLGSRALNRGCRSLLLSAGLIVGTSTLWAGSDSAVNLVALLIIAALAWAVRRRAQPVLDARPA